MSRKIRVLVVDDSAVIRRVFKSGLDADPRIEVVGTAPDPYVAKDLLLQLKPDVVTLDLEMPRMDGLTFLGKIMVHFPTPVIVVSSLSSKGSDVALDALRLGAVQVLHKPNAAFSGAEMVKSLVQAVKSASLVKLKKAGGGRAKVQEKAKPVLRPIALKTTTNKLIAIGSSTGGTVAVERILTQLPENMPGILITQHMPPGVTASFAQRLDKMCRIEVREAKSGDSVVPGVALLAPGSHHMALKRSGSRYYVDLIDGPPINYHRPSVDLTFRSVARVAGANAIGVILTGMGRDGADGLLEMREAGSQTIGQDEASCVVYGMPKVAFDIGAVETVLPLSEIAESIIKKLHSTRMSVTGGLMAKGA